MVDFPVPSRIVAGALPMKRELKASADINLVAEVPNVAGALPTKRELKEQ